MSRKHVTHKRVVVGLGLVILLLALWVRLAYFTELQSRYPEFLENKPFCGLDANTYHGFALGLLDGSWPSNSAFYYMILYPFYLAAIYSLVGVSLKVVAVMQILLEVVACAALFGLGRLVFNRWVGLLAGALFAFYGPLIFYNACFAQAALSNPFYVLTLFFLLKAYIAGRLRYVWLAGLLASLAVLSRPTFLLLLPAALLWWLVNRIPLRRLAVQAVIYISVVFLVTLPATLHNYRMAHHMLPTPITGWSILFLGNNPIAEGMGTLDYVLYIYTDLPGEDYIVSVNKTAQQIGPQAFRDEALKFITGNPLDWLNLIGRKAYLLLGETDDRIISPYFLHNLQTVPFLRYFPLTWRSVFIGALLGMLLVKHKHRSLLLPLLIAVILFTILFHIQFRFRLLLVPLVVLYAAALIVMAPRLGRVRFVLALIVLAGLCPVLPELGWLLALFIASALLPWAQRKNWPRLRRVGLATWSYFVIAILLSQVITFAGQTGQPQSIFLGPQISGPVAVGQSFVMHCDGFNRLSLVLGTFGDTHPQPVTLHLRAGPNQSDDIYHATFDIIGMRDRTRREFTFPAQANSANQSYFFFLEAPSTPPTEAITARGAYDRPFDRYREGSAYAGRRGAWQKLSADLAFNAYCDVGLFNIADQAFKELAANTFGSTAFYWTVFIVHWGLFIGALLKLRPLLPVFVTG